MVHRAVKNTSFDSQPGQRIGGKYHIEAFLGGGLQGEVYRVLELHTRVRRAAKLFFPQQNHGGRAARNYAQRLDRLRDCPIVVQYHHAEEVRINGIDVTCLLSEYVDCILLYDFIARHTGSHLPAFKALHVLYPLVCGLAPSTGATTSSTWSDCSTPWLGTGAVTPANHPPSRQFVEECDQASS
jgi:hypothetical protein